MEGTRSCYTGSVIHVTRDTTALTLPWPGMSAQATVTCTATEMAKRARLDYRRLVSYDLQEALSTLPVGMQVPRTAFRARELACIDGAPVGVVDSAGGMLTRLLARPLRIAGILARGTDWRRTMRGLLLFRTVAPVTIVLEKRPRDLAGVLHASHKTGIGVRLDGPDGGSQLVPPQPLGRLDAMSAYVEEMLASSLLDRNAGQL